MKQRILQLTMLLMPYLAIAQTTISGKITDSGGQGLPGVNVYVKDTYDGGTTDATGKFSFTTSETGKLTIVTSLIGFESGQQQITAEGKPISLILKLKEKVNELNVVTISAGSIEASDTKKAVILNSLDIVTTAGANGDIYGALQTLPGTQPIGETEGLFVRGGAASEAKTIIDGLPVAHPYQSSVPDVAQRGRFSPFLFKETVFSTGGYSAEYGQAMSSALILNTTDIPDITNTNVGLTTVGGSVGHNHRWKNTSVGVDVNYTNLSPYYKLFPPNINVDKAPQAYGGDFIFRQKTSQTGLFKVYAAQSNSEISLFSKDPNSPANNNKFELNNTLSFVTASYKELLNSHWSVFAATSYAYNKDERYFTPYNYQRIDVSSNDDSKQAKLTLTRTLGRLSKLKIGGEYNQSSFTNGAFQDSRTNFTSYTGVLKDSYYGAFAESDIYLTQKLVARAGVRSEYSKAIDKRNTAPRLSMAYKTGNESQVSFAYGQFYQTPGNFYIAKAAAIDAPKPDFEMANHYIANYQKINNNRTFRVEAYYKQYNDLIKVNPVIGSAPVQPVNGALVQSITSINNNGDGYARGIDVFYRDKQLIKYTDFWISYSYLDTKRNYLDYPISATPAFAAKHTFSVVLKRGFNVSGHLINLNGTYTFATGRPYYNPNNNNNIDFLSDHTKAYHNVSLSASYLTSIAGNFTVLVLSCSNVFAIQNVFGYRYSSTSPSQEPVPLVAASPRFVFIGMFINIGGKKISDDNL